jgi:hypothetical protein
MCTDFTNLNKWCPKDDFPLARIDQIINSVASSDIMALLDCFSGYHQIWLHREDEEKTSFITPFDTYCYLRMMCIDFTNLNKWCLKDDSPLAMIDQIINSAAGSNIMALLDCFSGYHQIWLHREDEEKTSFITPFGTYWLENGVGAMQCRS